MFLSYISSMPFSINPGGLLPPNQVVGRGELVQQLWSALEGRSVALVAPRRVGKSHVLHLAATRVPVGWRLCISDLQDVRSIGRFLELLYTTHSGDAGMSTRWQYATNTLLSTLVGRVGGDAFNIEFARPDWVRVLRALLDDLVAAATARDERIVLAWDEFTWFLQNLVREGKRDDASALLDALRAVRLSPAHRRLRFCFTGSIGLEEVLRQLAPAGEPGAPMNDVERIEVRFLSEEAARELATGLVRVGGAPPTSRAANRIARVTQGHPYIIHHVARELRNRRSWTAADVDDAVDSFLRDGQDPLELNGWMDRLSAHGPERKEQIMRVFDAVALGATDVASIMQATGLERSTVADALRVLKADLYVRDEKAGLRVGFELLRRYWLLARGLA